MTFVEMGRLLPLVYLKYEATALADQLGLA